jgi:hypothetical protein
MTRSAAAVGLVLALGAGAAAAEGFPKGDSYIIQLVGSQFESGMGEYLVPPLKRAMDRSGLRYKGGPGADWVATVESGSDVGAWHGEDWLYTRDVTVGLSPGSMDVEPEGRLAPAFAITARIVTPDADRVDELDCLIALAARELAHRYRATGRVVVNGQSCLR